MTALRPEREGQDHEPRDPYGGYADDAAFEEAVGQLADPLNDPLPGQRAAEAPRPQQPEHRQPRPPRFVREETQPAQTAGQRTAPPRQAAPQPEQAAGTQGSPWFRPHQQPVAPAAPVSYAQGPAPGLDPQTDPYEPIAAPASIPEPVPGPAPSPEPPLDDATMALRQATQTEEAEGDTGTSAGPDDERVRDTVSRETETAVPTGGRAARRKAAKRGGRRARNGAGSPAAEKPAASTAPMTRMEARRAAKARKDSPSVIASRAVGELFITLGVLMLLFVTYQLWWTNVLAHQEAGGEADNLQQQWDGGGAPDRSAGAFSPGQGFAIMYIPKLDVKVPVAEGISKNGVLDKGMVGHYGEGKLKTAMPWDKKGNFAVAGHRNTHGEPFRYVNKLVKGDKIVVETRDTFYTYEMAGILPQTSPSNVAVIDPVPTGSGFTGPGRYITLTTCTPEFTSTYRMIVWGKMVEERPRSKGKPDALVS